MAPGGTGGLEEEAIASAEEAARAAARAEGVVAPLHEIVLQLMSARRAQAEAAKRLREHTGGDDNTLPTTT